MCNYVGNIWSRFQSVHTFSGWVIITQSASVAFMAGLQAVLDWPDVKYCVDWTLRRLRGKWPWYAVVKRRAGINLPPLSICPGTLAWGQTLSGDVMARPITHLQPIAVQRGCQDWSHIPGKTRLLTGYRLSMIAPHPRAAVTGVTKHRSSGPALHHQPIITRHSLSKPTLHCCFVRGADGAIPFFIVQP